MDTAAIGRSWRAWIVHDEAPGERWWAGCLWTLVFCCVVAAGFTVLGLATGNGGRGRSMAMGLWNWYQINLMISLCIGFAIHFGFMGAIAAVGRPRLRRLPPWQRTAFYSIVPLIGVAIGWPLGLLWALRFDVWGWLSALPPAAFVSSLLLCVLITLLFQQFFLIKTRQFQAESRASEAQLRLLQAQIEPHFLFNTLANVASLIEVDAPRARLMLESFVDYLRASLAGFGQGRCTLGDEIELVEAYLRVIQIRMEDRLRYTIDVPAALRSRALPALTLQPLVENAIIHGLEPRIDGGSIRVVARLEGDALRLSVTDDGAGLATPSAWPASTASSASSPSSPVFSPRRGGQGALGGAGTALANIRERLRQAYGEAAGLHLDAAEPHGVRATLHLPAARQETSCRAP